jgi:DNA-binding response OmpR family regulator
MATPVMKVLVVDDDLASGPLLKVAMKNDFEVHTETAGAEAVARALSVDPGAIILDINMPNVDGYEVLRQLKRHPRLAATPVICMSGDDGEVVRSRVFALGAAGFIGKPLAIAKVSKDLKSMLNALNVEIDGKARKFTIAFNEAEKYRLMKEAVRNLRDQGTPVTVLSLLEGSHFCDSELNVAIESGEFVYLNIAPSLIAKFPFLNDLSPVVTDLKEFLPARNKPWAVILDDPFMMTGAHESRSALSRLQALKDALGSDFSFLSLFCARQSTPESAALMNEMAVLFCR